LDISRQQLWNQVKSNLQFKLTRPAFETWIETSRLQDWQDNRLTIQAANPFILNHLQKNYLTILTQTLEEILGHSVEIHLTAPQTENTMISSDFTGYLDEKNANSREHPHPTQLNSKYTFGRFVVGPTNRMAHAATLAVAESPGREFNPLFLCGGVGLGKTHLMQAIAHYRLALLPESKIFYVSTEQFTNDLITAIRQDSMESFREHYRTADILLVDDIQFIEGKEYTQEEFFHTFNTLHEAGKQVVIASDRPPKQISSLQDRLTSRFSMGLIADIQAPDLETRMAILQKKADYEKLRLPRDVIEYIATNYTSNIRELEGALIRATTYISISGLEMTVGNLAPFLNPAVAWVVSSPEIILNLIAEVYRISVEDLKSNSRRREISQARQVGMYLMRQHTDLSLPRIGEEFGGKDHTTVMYSCEKIAQSQQEDASLRLTLTQLSDRLSVLGR
jgi:chromosomal replication initiator protein